MARIRSDTAVPSDELASLWEEVNFWAKTADCLALLVSEKNNDLKVQQKKLETALEIINKYRTLCKEQLKAHDSYLRQLIEIRNQLETIDRGH